MLLNKRILLILVLALSTALCADDMAKYYNISGTVWLTSQYGAEVGDHFLLCYLKPVGGTENYTADYRLCNVPIGYDKFGSATAFTEIYSASVPVLLKKIDQLRGRSGGYDLYAMHKSSWLPITLTPDQPAMGWEIAVRVDYLRDSKQVVLMHYDNERKLDKIREMLAN